VLDSSKMDWKAALDIVALLVGIVALVVSMYAIHDAREKARDAILISRIPCMAKYSVEFHFLDLERRNFLLLCEKKSRSESAATSERTNRRTSNESVAGFICTELGHRRLTAQLLGSEQTA
jgi:hypothetical protein